MQTLSDFYSNWHPEIIRQSKEVGDKFEAGRNMSRFLSLEPQLRAEVDDLCREYSKSADLKQISPRSADAGYLFHIRLLQAAEFAQFLDHCGFGSTEMSAQDWIEFLTIVFMA